MYRVQVINTDGTTRSDRDNLDIVKYAVLYAASARILAETDKTIKEVILSEFVPESKEWIILDIDEMIKKYNL